MLGSDPDAVKGTKLERALVRRVWRFAHPYRAMLVGFLITIVLEAFVGLGPILLIKRIVDEIVGAKDESLVTTLGLLMIAFAVNLVLTLVGQRQAVPSR